MRRTKIVGTIGPASSDKKILKKLILSGMNVIRLNMSHGDSKYHGNNIRTLRQIEKELNVSAAVLVDLQGPRIRTGKLKEKQAFLAEGDTVELTPRAIMGNASIIPVNYPKLASDVKAGGRILMDNGFIELRVIKLRGKDVVCKVIDGGLLGENKGINLPGVELSIPTLTAKDREDLRFAIKAGADYIGVSFVRSEKDIAEVKRILTKAGSAASVIAKIEKPEALKSIDRIIDLADGLMVARGDLGVEISPEAVPVIQKELIHKCNRRGKIVITATQMLESMVRSTRPTRAEASDVANAVFDGSDAIMLSEEVAVGKYPVRAVETMGRIARAAEKIIIAREHSIKMLDLKGSIIESSVGHASAMLAENLSASAIVTFTSSGYTSLLISKYRPDAPVWAMTPSISAARKACLFWGTTPIIVRNYKNVEQMFKLAEKTLLKMKVVKKGDTILTIAGVPVGEAGRTNLIRIMRVGE